MAYLRRAKARKGDTGKSPRNAKILLMIGNLLARIFPNYESRAMLKECREDWRADALNLNRELKAARLEVEKWKALANTRAKEIEYLHGLAETMADRIAGSRAAALA